jgi:dTDP-4-amino-4,6-dideoxygalactose transaminase
MALTNNRVLAEKMDLYRSHGITRNPNLMSREAVGAWYYEQITLGYNYRMTDLQAALGISQMERLSDFVTRRQKLASRYNKLLNHSHLITPYQLDNTYSSFHLYVVRLKLDKLSISHLDVFKQLTADGIGVNLHYIPVHTQPYYESKGFKAQDFPEAMNYYQEAISLPLYPGLTYKHQDHVVATLEALLNQ